MAARKIKPSDYQPIADRYRKGETLVVIGEAYGVTRERIRQILKKNGIDPKSGGIARTAEIKRLKRKAKQDRRCLERYGITLAEREYITAVYGAKPFRSFTYHIRNSKMREIPFLMTFKDWWEIWDKSGKWNQCGRNRGQYVMARYGDQGPYAPDNVHIITCTENICEVREREHGGDYSETINKALAIAASNSKKAA